MKLGAKILIGVLVLALLCAFVEGTTIVCKEFDVSADPVNHNMFAHETSEFSI